WWIWPMTRWSARRCCGASTCTIELRTSASRFRGRGLASDVIRVLCGYGFAVRGLHRLQIETLADNTPMIRASAAAGFLPEGTLRHSAWVDGEFADQVV